MKLPRITSVLGAIGLASSLASCKVDLCDRYANNPLCLIDMEPQAQVQISPRHIPLQATPAIISITLLTTPDTPQKVTLVQNGKTVDLGTISTTGTISPNLRAQVLPGPATIQVGTQQVAVRLYVPPIFSEPAVPRPVKADLGDSTQQPVSPTALGVTGGGQIVMLGQYGSMSTYYQGLKPYVLNGSIIDLSLKLDLSSFDGVSYPSPSGFALTTNHIYFPFQNAGGQPTYIRQINAVSAKQVKGTAFAFSAISLFTADPTGQIIAAITTDKDSGAKKLTMFSAADLSLNTGAAIDAPPDPTTLVFLGAGDLSGDNVADLATWDMAGNVKVYLGTDGQKVDLKYNAAYSGNLTTASMKLGSKPVAISLGDLDGDLVSDVALVGSTGNIALVLNELDGNFSMSLSVPMPTGFSNPSALAIGNTNMDALLQSNDLVISNNGPTPESKLIAVLVNQATKNWPQ